MARNNFSKASANNFQLIFPRIPTGDSVNDMKSLTMNIHSTIIPAITLTTTDVLWQGGRAHQSIGEATFENWNVGFTIDSNFQNWLTLYKWLTYINNNDDKFGRPTDQYKVDATLHILNNFRQKVVEVTYRGVWINSLGEVSLNFREGQSNLESSANFIYDRYEVRNI